MNMNDCKTLQVVLAEDNPGDVELVREALDAQQLSYQLTVKNDGEQMIQFIQAVDRAAVVPPDLILLDLNLPRADGATLLKHIRACKSCAEVPLIVITSSDSPRDRQVAAEAKANEYFRKPSDFDEFLRLGEIVRSLVNRAPES